MVCIMGNYFSKKDLIYTVYQEKSISKAAQKLFMPQPSLSVMIKRIEEEVGVPLFDRTCKPIRLTEAGMEYIKATEAIMHTEKAFENYLQSCLELQTGALTIGANQLLSSLVLPRYIGRFINQHPNIRLNLVDDNSVVLENMATAGQLDLIIDNYPLDASIFQQHILRNEHLLLAVPTNFSCNTGLKDYSLTYEEIKNGEHLLGVKAGVPLKAFEGVPFVAMTRENETRNRSNEIFREAGVKPHILLEIDRLVTLYSFVEQGSAAAIVSDTLVQYLQSGGKNVVFYRIDSEHAVRALYLSYKRNRYYSKPMEAFAKLIQELK